MERKARLKEETGTAWEETPEKVKRTTEMVLAMTTMMEAMNANPNASSNFDGLKGVLEQPMMSFKEALFNPLLEGVFNDASPLINEAMPIMEDLAGTVGALLKPVFQGLADVLKLLTPAIDWITTMLNNSFTQITNEDWDFVTERSPEERMATGMNNAAAGAMTGAGIAAASIGATSLLFGPPGWAVGAAAIGIGTIAGGIIGFAQGFW